MSASTFAISRAACIFYYLATTLPENQEGYTWIGSLKLGDYSYAHFREIDLWRRYTTLLYFAIDCRCKNLDKDLGSSKSKRIDNGVLLEEDRISRLPDALLVNILSLLPSKDAVATSVLSRRWGNLFTWVTCLDFDDSPISHCVHNPHMINSFPNFKNFVDKFLQLCQFQNITTYRLHFGTPDRSPFKWPECREDCFPGLEPMHLNVWMCFPLSRQVKELDICAHVRKPGQLPLEIFGCETLEVLKVDVNLHLETPLSLCLPNLKELHLTLPVIPDGDFVTRIVSSCPFLDHLALEGQWNPMNPIVISSTSLHKLNIYMLNRHCICERTKVVLDVPNLEHLMYRDISALHYSIGHMNALVKAQVDIKYCLPETIVNLAWMLPNVRHLFIEQTCVEPLQFCESKLKLPVFQNLNHLQLGCFNFYDWNKMLLELLNCSPILETLAFPEGIAFDDSGIDDRYLEVSERECKSWSSTQTVPSCLVSHLRKITISHYLHTDWELEVIKYFLRNSLVLEELDIFLKQIWIPEDMILQKLPRASKNCSIRLHEEGRRY